MNEQVEGPHAVRHVAEDAGEHRAVAHPLTRRPFLERGALGSVPDEDEPDAREVAHEQPRRGQEDRQTLLRLHQTPERPDQEVPRRGAQLAPDALARTRIGVPLGKLDGVGQHADQAGPDAEGVDGVAPDRLGAGGDGVRQRRRRALDQTVVPAHPDVGIVMRGDDDWDGGDPSDQARREVGPEQVTTQDLDAVAPEDRQQASEGAQVQVSLRPEGHRPHAARLQFVPQHAPSLQAGDRDVEAVALHARRRGQDELLRPAHREPDRQDEQSRPPRVGQGGRAGSLGLQGGRGRAQRGGPHAGLPRTLR